MKRRGTFFHARASAALAAFCLLAAAGYAPAQEAQPAPPPAPLGPELWVKELRDADAPVRLAARDNLLKAGGEAVRPLIASIEGNRTRDIAWSVLAALGPKATPGLISLLRDPDLRVRAGGAMFAMIDGRSSDQAPALLACAKDLEVRNYCLQSLVKAMDSLGIAELVFAGAIADTDVRTLCRLIHDTGESESDEP
ncbi:MAG: hypothetical protein AAB576_06220, partial [Elusimicrobiota bacterium]